MASGTVISLNKGSGYGFIHSDDDQEIFFHQRWLNFIKFRDIKVGSKVVYDIQKGHRGRRAVNLRFAPDDESFHKNLTTRNRKKPRH